MTIRPNKENYAYIVILFICISLFDTVLFIENDNQISIFIICITPILLWITFRFAITVGKTLIFCNEGCIVSMLGYRKLYTWDKLETKRLEDYKNTMSFKRQFFEGAFFLSVRLAVRDGWAHVNSAYLHIHSLHFS